MTIYLLRHGDAIESATLHDSERPLSDLGEQQASTAGIFLHSVQPQPITILCSPLLRAKQTAEAVRKNIEAKPPLVLEFLTPSSDPRQLFAELNKMNDETVLIVGHEPYISTAISLLISGNEQTRVEIKKASLACIEARKPIGKIAGYLRWLVTANQMMLKM